MLAFGLLWLDWTRGHSDRRAVEGLRLFVPDWSKRSEPRFAVRTDGVAGALWMCGGMGRPLAALLYAIPRFVRNAGYRFVSRTRYKLFGPWKACPLPRPEWAKRFME